MSSLLWNSTPYPQYTDAITHAKGCYVYDDTGRRWLDLESGVWCLPLGHQNDAVTAALQAQLARLTHVGYQYSAPIVEDAAAELLSVAGFAGRCVFLSSGSEAVEYALQAAGAAARANRGRTKMACLAGQFFSSYGLAGEGKAAWFQQLTWDEHAEKSVESWKTNLSCQIDFGEVGVFLLEPGNGCGLVHLPPANLVTAIEELCNAAGTIKVVDEVTTGIGRTGRWFGFQHTAFTPDLIACGKGLGNGCPVSAVILREPFFDQMHRVPFDYAQSHQNDPFAAAAALAVLREMKRLDLPNAAATTARYFAGQYAALCAAYPFLQEYRARGLMLCLQFTPDTPVAALRQLGKFLFDHCIIAALKIPPRALRTYPPLILTTDQVNEYIEVLKLGLDRFFEKFHQP